MYPAMRDNFYGVPVKITVQVLVAGCQLSYHKAADIFYRVGKMLSFSS